MDFNETATETFSGLASIYLLKNMSIGITVGVYTALALNLYFTWMKAFNSAKAIFMVVLFGYKFIIQKVMNRFSSSFH